MLCAISIADKSGTRIWAKDPRFVWPDGLAEDPETRPQPIHLGFRLGTHHLRAYLKSLEEIGINHVALNLRFNQADIETTLERLANKILPDFA